MNKTEHEIGSEFWTNCTPRGQSNNGMRALKIYEAYSSHCLETLSGRTALEYIVEIMYGQGKRMAYLPSYCCHTMIEPFVKHGISVCFYDVVWTGHGLNRILDVDNKSDMVLLMDYFGHTDMQTVMLSEKLRKTGKTVIYDATHSMFSIGLNGLPYDFVYGSYRKWIDINCGFFVWNEDLFEEELSWIDNNENYAKARKEFFDLKADFMNGKHVSKDQFLPLMETAESILEKEYHHKLPDARSMEVLLNTDVEFLKSRRLENARLIIDFINGLKDERLSCINPLLNSTDIPLFVPVLFESEVQRNAARNYLIEHDIYCPVHWPLSELHLINNNAKKIYEKELSIICDQRYDNSDMYRIINTINNFLKTQ